MTLVFRQAEANRVAIHATASRVGSTRIWRALVSLRNAILKGISCKTLGAVADGIAIVQLAQGI